jgi:ADP-ribose pyrophosphatase YjhB (NUDIX family)
MLDRMGESPLLAGWTSCPRCRHRLEREEKSVRCPACGLAVYANPAATASAVILDDDGRVLLAKRAVDPGAGLWDLIGGFIDEGEDPLDALRREVREELSVEVEPGRYLGAYPDRYGDDGVYTLNLYWAARLTAGDVRVDDSELEEVAWFRAEELPRRTEFAFANTVAALDDWRAEVGSDGDEK